MNKKQLRNEIEKRSSSYSDKELFASPYFAEILQGLVEGLCENRKKAPILYVNYEPNSFETSHTDGNEIHHNSASPLIRNLSDTWKKYISNVGTVTHECLHVLFTDFTMLNPLRKSWNGNKFWFQYSQPDGFEKIIDYCNTHPSFKRIYAKECCDMVNILEDMYIENIGYQEYSGLCTAGITLKNKEKYNYSNTEEELFDLASQGIITLASVANVLMQMRELGFTPKTGDIKKLDSEPIKADRKRVYDYLDKVKTFVNVVEYSKSSNKRAEAFEAIAAAMFELYNTDENQSEEGGEGSEDETNDETSNQNSSSQDQQGSNFDQMGEDDLDQLENAINQLLENNGVSKEAEGQSSPSSFSGQLDQNIVDQNKQSSDNLVESDASMKMYIDQIKKEIAKKEAIEDDEIEHLNKLQEEADEIDNLNQNRGTSVYKGLSLNRPAPVSKYSYEAIYCDISDKSKTLQRKIRNILKERKTEGYDSGYFMGQKFNPGDIYHKDGKYFSREIVPDGQPDVVFGILVDESGSMSGKKINKARQTTILLEDVLRNLDIPAIICGHTTSYYTDEVLINNYVDFDTNDGKDKYRLGQICSSANNIDGAAITYIGEKLSKRPENIKVMIVISDGAPCGGSYYSNNPDEDTKEAIKKYRKKDINIFGAIIDDYSQVASLYGNNYCFDCTNGDSLQRELIKLIKKYILIN